MAAADRAISGNPSTQLRALSDPKVVSPVGDAGRTNFGNEPRLTTPSPTPRPATPTPTPRGPIIPPVSL